MGTQTIEVTKDNYKSQVTDNAKPVIVDLWAEWCMPCKMIAPLIDQIAEEQKGTIDVCKINIDDHPELATEMSVMNIPTLIFFKGGREAGRVVGVSTKEAIGRKIKECFG